MKNSDSPLDINSLMIGNYFTNIIGEVRQVNQILEDSVSWIIPNTDSLAKTTRPISELNPIFLTEELFLKFPKTVKANKFIFDENAIAYDRFRFSYKKSYGYWYVVEASYITKIQFVHEFQNFIFILNGEKLTFKD
jgi:hypothetical protein